MASMNPIVIVAIALLVISAAFLAIMDLRKHLPKNEKKFSLRKSQGETLDVNALIKSDSIDPNALPGNLNVGNFRNYKKYSQEETMVYSSASVFTKIRIFLRTHLNTNYNLLNETEYIVLAVMGLVIGGAVGFWAMRTLLFVAIVGVIGLITPEVYLRFQVKQYREEINKQSIILTQLVIQGMRTGVSIGEAFERSAKQLQGPIEKEVDVLSSYFRGGFSFQDAARRAQQETASTFLKKIYRVIIMSMETRVSPDKMIERLAIVRKNLIIEYFLKESMRAQAGGATLAKNILICIVPALLLLVLKNSPVMLKPLISGPTGWAVIAIGIGLYVGGIYSSSKTLKKLEV